MLKIARTTLERTRVLQAGAAGGGRSAIAIALLDAGVQESFSSISAELAQKSDKFQTN